MRAVHARVAALSRQNSFYERQIDSARGRVVFLLMAQLRGAEVAHADEYIARIDEALAEISERQKKAEKGKSEAKDPK